jgi:hypothetical protein
VAAPFFPPLIVSSSDRRNRQRSMVSGRAWVQWERGDISSSGGIAPVTWAQPSPAVDDTPDRVDCAASLSYGSSVAHSRSRRKMTSRFGRCYNDIEA